VPGKRDNLSFGCGTRLGRELRRGLERARQRGDLRARIGTLEQRFGGLERAQGCGAGSVELDLHGLVHWNLCEDQALVPRLHAFKLRRIHPAGTRHVNRHRVTGRA